MVGGGEECTKWICKGKKNELEERFTKEFVKKEEKYIGYEDQLKTTEVSLLYSTTVFFFCCLEHFSGGRCINC